MDSFKALLIEERDGQVVSNITRFEKGALDAGEVTIRVAYSSVNYKDALAATGAGKIIRRFPCIGGIDLSGIVIDSADPRFKAGDQVIATSFDIGVAHHGGYAEIARVPADWVVPLPFWLVFV
jgi:acrylyl-CoA reductase (NADPH)